MHDRTKLAQLYSGHSNISYSEIKPNCMFCDMKWHFKNADKTKAARPDGIPSIVLKRLTIETALHLHLIYVLSLGMRWLPVDVRLAPDVLGHKGIS